MGMTAIRRICQRMLVGVVVVIVVAMGLGVFFVSPKIGSSGPDYQYHGPAVRVNRITLKDAEFQKHLLNVAREASQFMFGGAPGEEQMREDALQRAIRDLVIKSEIKKNKIRVPNADVDRYFNRLAKVYFPTKEEKKTFYEGNGYKGDRDFKGAIREYLAQLYLYLELSKQKKLDIKVTQAEVKDAYATMTIDHILLGTTEDGGLKEAEAKQKADEVCAKLKAGGDWGKLAQEYSTDTSNKDKNGSLGEIRVKDMRDSFDKDFTAAALVLKVGEISEPVKSKFGYHIIRVTDRKEAAGPEFQRAARMTEAEIVAQKISAGAGKYNEWLEARVAEADVTILDAALRAYQLRVKEDWTQAAKFYETAVKMRQHRWDRDVFVSALEVFLHEKQWDKAITYGRRAFGRFKEDVQLTASVGQALYQRAKGKDRTEGRAMLAKARTLAGEDIESLGLVKQAYDGLKLTKEAKDVETKIQEIIRAQALEQEQQQKAYEEEQARQEAAAKEADEAAKTATPGPTPVPTPGSTKK